MNTATHTKPVKVLIIPGGMPDAVLYKLEKEQQGIMAIGSSSQFNDPAEAYYNEWIYLPPAYTKVFSEKLIQTVKLNNIETIFTPHILVHRAIENLIEEHPELYINLEPVHQLKRTTSIEEILSTFCRYNKASITEVIDIGVQYGTPFLMNIFGQSKHYLIEPVKQYHSTIRQNYHSREIEHQLIPYALADKKSSLFLHEYSLLEEGKTSHSSIRSEIQEHPQLYKTSKISVSTLDSIFRDPPLKAHEFIVKIDVDGLEEKIIKGGKTVLQNAALVILEAPLSTVQNRINLLVELGFELWDICDPAFYDAQLSQVDLVFINKTIQQENINFRPWDKGPFDINKWYGK